MYVTAGSRISQLHMFTNLAIIKTPRRIKKHMQKQSLQTIGTNHINNSGSIQLCASSARNAYNDEHTLRYSGLQALPSRYFSEPTLVWNWAKRPLIWYLTEVCFHSNISPDSSMFLNLSRLYYHKHQELYGVV